MVTDRILGDKTLTIHMVRDVAPSEGVVLPDVFKAVLPGGIGDNINLLQLTG